ncbi:hypothetical protein ACS0TY_000655 [Phlomoides rotata]
MSRITFVTKLVRLSNLIKIERAQPLSFSYSSMQNSTIFRQNKEESIESEIHLNDSRIAPKHQIGENVPRRDKIRFLVNSLMDLQDNKEAIYSTLDAWVAWERNFPIASLKNVLLALERDQQWHRVIQIRDHRVEEAHEIWKKKLAFDLHSVPWKLCDLVMSVYYRNNMREDLVKLFKGLESFDRKPPEKSIVQKVADAYDLLGLPEEKERILKKYKDLFAESSSKRKSKKISRDNSPKNRKSKPVLGEHGVSAPSSAS